jgi:hypothetical protein
MYTPMKRNEIVIRTNDSTISLSLSLSLSLFHSQPGTTLRSYLAEKLQSDPMRITKKFSSLTNYVPHGESMPCHSLTFAPNLQIPS